MYENDGILPIIDLLSLKEKNALAAATGAIWKCAQSEVNARRYVSSNQVFLSIIRNQISYRKECRSKNALAYLLAGLTGNRRLRIGTE